MKIDVSQYQQQSKSKKVDSKTSFWNKDISFSKFKLNDKSKEMFYSDFLILLKAGLDVQSSLEILSSEQKKKGYKETISSIESELVSGKTLSESLKKTSQFTPYEYMSVKIGEETGNLPMILEQLSSFYYGKIKIRRLFIKAITYPSFILLVTFGILIFMLNYVVPMFEDVFSQFDKELPALTQNVLNISEFLQTNLKYIFLGILIIIGILYLQKEKTWFRKSTSSIVLKIPFFGKLVKQIYLARFYQYMYLLTYSKHNLIESIQLIKDVISFYPIEVALEQVKEDLKKGEPLYLSLKKHTIFDSRLVTLVKVAESSNQLDKMFEKLSKQEQESLEIKTETMGSVIEPLMIIFIGILVGIILISMYLPLFNLTEVI